MKMKKLSAVCLAAVIIFSMGVIALHAQTPGDGGNGGTPGSGGNGQQLNFGIQNPFSKVGDNLLDVLKAIFDQIVLPIGGVVAVLSFIWVGFMFVMARGDEGAIAKARQAFLYTAIGTGVLLGAEVISQVIGNTLNKLQ